jgi:histidinol dehydrogenase
MMCRIVRIRSDEDWPELARLIDGRARPDEDVEREVRAVLADVEQRGDEALLDYTRRFDCPDMTPPLRLGGEEIRRAAAGVDARDRDVIARAAENIRSFHEAQRERSWHMYRPDGSMLGQRILPVDRVGLYVPGGQGGETPLVSSLLMSAVPARVAGVREIAVVSPPRRDGSLSPHILAAAHLLDVDEVYRVGGAWAIGALSFGTASIPSVDVVAGPGNIRVTTAKRLVQGKVGIDMTAGPSEILILADSSASPAWVAADMLSQAEHDELACAVCLTADAGLAESVLRELALQCGDLPRAAVAAKALKRWGAVALVPDMDLAVRLSNKIAPEHLELLVRDPWSLLPGIRHAGAVFLGAHSPEAAGDYFAGPNHVLPTLGTARFSSALSVQTFCKRTNIIAASPAFMREHADHIARLARLEGLEAHARSALIRKK